MTPDSAIRNPQAAIPPLPYVGVDLTAGKRVSDVAGLDLAGERVGFAIALTDDDLLGVLAELGAAIVAVDSPMGLPTGLCCLEEGCSCGPPDGAVGRSAERALIKRGIPCFWTTKRTIIKSMIYRAIDLKTRLEGEGYTVLEVFPYAVKRILLGRNLPRKNRPEGIRYLVDGARGALPHCCWPEPWAPGHDQLDALYCAITARMFALGQTEALGDPAEVPIIVPGHSKLPM
jgi:predicted nuclease with RNAse H fold